MDGLWATTSEGVVLIILAISFQDFQPMRSLSRSTNVTDGQADGRRGRRRRHAIARPIALHYSASIAR